jgi:predicted RNA-binding protein YlxR (DUF448 family)
VSEGEAASVVVDVASSGFGRGAHVHASPDCVAKALKGGFARVFKTRVEGKAQDFAAQLVAAADRRIEGLLMGARRARHLVIGGDSVVEGLRGGKVKLVVVARDAAAAAQLGEVRDAVAAGKAIAWSLKGRLGALLAKDEVAVCGVVHDKVAAAIEGAYRNSRPFFEGVESVESVGSAGGRIGGGAWSSSEVR